jgi:Arc/MetJ-type ribon-helix-helix transcriptional regulator
MPDTRKSSDRLRQTSFRLGVETDEAIAWLRDHLEETDPLRRAVSAADVIRTAVREMFERCTKKSSQKSPKRD